MITRCPSRLRTAKTLRGASVVTCFGVLGLLLAACSSGGASATSRSDTSTTSGSASLSAFQSCLSQHGVTLPSFPGGSGSGGAPPAGGFPEGGSPPTGGGAPGGGFTNNPKFQAASKACASLRPKGGFPGGNGGANSSAFAAYRNCLKLHGVTLPTASPGSTSSSSIPSTTLDTSSPTVQAALSACSALRPDANSTTTTTSAG